MAKHYRIMFYPIAIDDLNDILDYIMDDNPKASVETIDTIDRSISQLERFPDLGVIPRDIRLKQLGYRMLVIDNYLAFYVVENDIVQIRRIIHGSRHYSFLI